MSPEVEEPAYSNPPEAERPMIYGQGKLAAEAIQYMDHSATGTIQDQSPNNKIHITITTAEKLKQPKQEQ